MNTVDKNINQIPNNNRRSVRYVRNDISVYLAYRQPLAKQTLAVKLLDLSSTGAFVLSAKKLPINKKITFILCFKNGEQFDIKAKIVRHDGQVSAKCRLGIKFDRYNNALGDCMLATQSKPVFR